MLDHGCWVLHKALMSDELSHKLLELIILLCWKVERRYVTDQTPRYTSSLSICHDHH